jgi:hypothetical protein
MVTAGAVDELRPVDGAERSAVDTVVDAVRQKRGAKVAMAVLKGLGMLE